MSLLNGLDPVYVFAAQDLPSVLRYIAVASSDIFYKILYTISTQQHQYSNIMYAIGYTVATCCDRKRSSSGQ